MKKTIISFFAAVAACCSLGAQSLPSLYLDYNPESLAKGSSSVVTSSILDSKLSADASFALWQPRNANDKLIGVNVSGKLSDRIALGLSAKMYNRQPYTITNDQGLTPQVNPTFTPKEMAFGLSGAFAITDAFSAGVTAKFATSALADDAKATVICGDVFARYATEKFSAGIAACNLGGKVKFGEYESAIPMMVRAGAAMSVIDNLNASAEVDYMFCGAFMASLGAEYWIADVVAPRVGFHYGAKDKGIPTFASVGLGVKFVGIKLNAAYLLASDTVGGTLCFGLGYSF